MQTGACLNVICICWGHLLVYWINALSSKHLFMSTNAICFQHIALVYLKVTALRQYSTTNPAGLLVGAKGSSETTDSSDYKAYRDYGFKTERDFYCWLGGLTDGDGSFLVTGGDSFLVTNKGQPSFELTLDTKDLPCLYVIQKVLGIGIVSKRSAVNAWRIRINKTNAVLELAGKLNPFLLTLSKRNQLDKLFYTNLPWGNRAQSFAPLNPTLHPTLNKHQVLLLIRNSSWLAGFFDADGHFTIQNEFTLTFNISQKDRLILDYIREALGLGHIRYDKSWDGWIYTISDREGIRFILDYLSKYPCQTTKRADVVAFKSIMAMMDLNYHFKGNPNYPTVEALVQRFKDHLKPLKP
jgi:hypothetical protein